MNYKRITLICGHYGSGKTNIAVNINNNVLRLTSITKHFIIVYSGFWIIAIY